MVSQTLPGGRARKGRYQEILPVEMEFTAGTSAIRRENKNLGRDGGREGRAYGETDGKESYKHHHARGEEHKQPCATRKGIPQPLHQLNE